MTLILSPKQAIAGITEAGDDVRVLVQPLVECSEKHRDIRMPLLVYIHTLRRGHEGEK
jgi:hypothetical protein